MRGSASGASMQVEKTHAQEFKHVPRATTLVGSRGDQPREEANLGHWSLCADAHKQKRALCMPSGADAQQQSHSDVDHTRAKRRRRSSHMRCHHGQEPHHEAHIPSSGRHDLTEAAFLRTFLRALSQDFFDLLGRAASPMVFSALHIHLANVENAISRDPFHLSCIEG